jgi:hypothetical protein
MSSGMRPKSLSTVLALLVAGCAAGLRATPETRYQGMVLNARTLGAEQLRMEMARDPEVRAYVERAGPPDHLYVAGPDDLELVYYGESLLVHFHRDAETGETTVTRLSPLPTELVNVLGVDLRAGTPGPISRGTSCWRIPAGSGTCRTCCRGPQRCATSCRGG